MFQTERDNQVVQLCYASDANRTPVYLALRIMCEVCVRTNATPDIVRVESRLLHCDSAMWLLSIGQQVANGRLRSM